MEDTTSEQKIASTDDRRTQNNTLRHSYRVLTEKEKADMGDVKALGQALLDKLEGLGSSREISIAKTKVEEAVMWGCKDITS